MSLVALWPNLIIDKRAEFKFELALIFLWKIISYPWHITCILLRNCYNVKMALVLLSYTWLFTLLHPKHEWEHYVDADLNTSSLVWLSSCLCCKLGCSFIKINTGRRFSIYMYTYIHKALMNLNVVSLLHFNY